MPLPRSFLYVPANRDKFLEKSLGLPADALLFDLEDSVPAAEKANARAGVKAYAPKVSGAQVWVRVNGLDTGLAEADLDAVIGVKNLAGAGIRGRRNPGAGRGGSDKAWRIVELRRRRITRCHRPRRRTIQ